MPELYQRMEEANPNHQNIVMTVLDGEAFGEKALVTNHKLVWESKTYGFYAKNQTAVETIDDTGIKTVGEHRLFCEVLGQEKHLVICGGGHVSIPIIRIGLMLGCSVTVLEDRPKFADHARQAGATNVLCEPFKEGLQKIESNEDTFFVIVTRGHRYDQICLEDIVRKPHAYIGMMGSKRRVALVKEQVIAGGGDPEVVQSVHTPIGLDIGAETPEEIAVAIMAEIIEVKNKKRRNCTYSKEIMKMILGDEAHLQKVLATIISRKGSAPREIGTKMLICPDGTCAGTIGGGCAEADVYQKALLMLRNGESAPKICHVDMTGKEAEEEGMVCGGVIEVLLEVIE